MCCSGAAGEGFMGGQACGVRRSLKGGLAKAACAKEGPDREGARAEPAWGRGRSLV